MEVSRDRLKLNEGRRVLSPPSVASPLYACATVVNVLGFVPNALLDLQVDGAVVSANVLGGFPYPTGAVIALPAALTVGQTVRARQRAFGRVSPWAPPVVVRDHRLDFPAGLPRPEIAPAPVYECGSRTGVSNLLIGCNVWITADGVEVGRVDGAVEHQGVNVNPFYGLSQTVRAWAALCASSSPPSQAWVTQHSALPLPTPTIVAPIADRRPSWSTGS